MEDLEKLLEEYVEDYHPTTLDGVITLTERYLQTIPDSQVKVLMYQMWKHLSGVEVIDSKVNSKSSEHKVVLCLVQGQGINRNPRKEYLKKVSEGVYIKADGTQFGEGWSIKEIE